MTDRAGPDAISRAYRPADEDELCRVCVLTGDSGTDATGLFDERLLPDIYVRPYLMFEPELATVVELGGSVVGYILAAADTAAFVESYRRHWLPVFRERHPLSGEPQTREERVVAIGYRPEHMLNADLEEFPAHLHIDLLPAVQGRGLGRSLIRTLLGQLRDRGVGGVHLSVGERNHGARAFYHRLGFRPLPSTPENPLALGLPTDATI